LKGKEKYSLNKNDFKENLKKKKILLADERALTEGRSKQTKRRTLHKHALTQTSVASL